MFFKRRPHLPLEQALQLIDAASDIIMQYKRNTAYMPTDHDFETLCHINEAYHQGYASAEYVECCLHQRLAREPEGSKKWHDKEVFDYHNPP